MKIIHVIWNIGQGGAQTYLVQLLHNLIAYKNLDIEVIVLTQRGELSEQLESLGVSVDYLGVKGGFDWIRFVAVGQKLLGAKPDLIHSHSHNIMFNVMLNVLRIPVVYTDHGGGLLSGRLMDKWIYRYLYRPIVAFLAISETMADVMRSVNPGVAERVITVPNGVELELLDAQDIRAEVDWPERVRGIKKRVGIVGRLVEQKGIDLFLDVAAEISKGREDVLFVIIGDGPLRSQLEVRAERLGIGGNVLFMGYKVDAVRWLKGFDVFLFTSRFEPFGLVLLEAMAARVPVVAAHIKGAVPEIIENNVNGVFVEGGDPVKLAGNVQNILEQPEFASTLTEKARNTVEYRYTMAINAQSVAAVYQQSAT